MKKNWDNPVEHAMPAEVRVPAEVRIGAVSVRPATVLAPMAGVTDTVFRRFIRHSSLFSSTTGAPGPSHLGTREVNSPETDPETREIDSPITNFQSGCGLLMTEFTSADGLSRMRESKRKRYLTFYEDEHPIAAQLFGSNPATLSEAARIVQDTGFDTVDLNLGCPAKRVVGCNGGSGLLRDLPKIRDIFRAVRQAVTIPFTVKFRLGWNDSQIVCVELAKIAESEGLNAVALHARTREQGYTGQARWEWIAAIKQAVSIPVIGNGDIRTPEDAAAMVAKTGCDAVMIGRAAPGNPWIFRQIAQYTATGAYDQPTVEDRYRMIRSYFQMLLDELEPGCPRSLAPGDLGSGRTTNGYPRSGEPETSTTDGCPGSLALGDPGYQEPPPDKSKSAGREVAGKMKQFASWFTHGVPGGARLRAAIYQEKTGAAVLSQVDAFFTRQLETGVTGEETSEPALFNGFDPALACGD